MKPKNNTEFVLLMAFMMSFAALSIDTILPALGLIASEFNLDNPNKAQWLLSALFLGMSFAYLPYGPLSDSYGRKPIMSLGIFIFVLGSLISIYSSSFNGVLVGRFVQGMGCASGRIITGAMIRDRYSGREMAKIFSFIMILFLLVPALAPSLGQLILHLAAWRMIFLFTLVFSLFVWTWMHFRQEETHPPERRLDLSIQQTWLGIVETLKNPISRSYMIASGLVAGALFSYILSSAQILQIQYKLGDQFVYYFGGMAMIVGLASFSNAKLVMKYGMEKICRSALYVLCGLSLFFYIFIMISEEQPSLAQLVGYLTLNMLCFGFLFSNFNTLALDPLGHIAGIANSVISTVQTIVSASLGTIVGYLYDGSVIPLISAFLFFGCFSLAITLRVQNYRIDHRFFSKRS